MTSIKYKCKNITQANKYISDIINSFKIDEIIDEKSIEGKIIIELIKYHPNKKININNLEWLMIKLRKPYNTPALYYKTNIEDDISWKLCIKNLYGKYDSSKEYINDVNNAFRNESHNGSKKQYFIDNTKIINSINYGLCKNCNIETSNITTDHYPIPYKRILESFIDMNKINLSEIDIFENEKNEIRIKDNEFAFKWLNYHDNMAEYRLLCNSCNSHFGAYGF